MGTLRARSEASPPSARIQVASFLAPTSSKSTRSGTPIHSEFDDMPAARCAVNDSFFGSRKTGRPLPEHSTK
jgi:hypothetical protein